jgi:hypothetical protein
MAIAADAIELTSFASAIDLLRDVTGGCEVLAIRVITAAAGASITGKTKGSGDVARVFTVAAGDDLPLAMRTIDTVTNVTRVRVYWGHF